MARDGSLETSVIASREAEEAVGRFLDDCPTSFAQQTPGWSRVIQSVGGDEGFYVVCRRGNDLVGALPAYVYGGPLGRILTSAAQAGALGGVACAERVDPEPVYEALLGAFLAFARDRECALATVYGNPIWPDHELCERILEPDYVLENACQVLDLEQGVDGDGGFPLASANVRRNLNKAESSGLVIDEDASTASVDEWYDLHATRHREIGAVPLPRSLFTGALREMVPRGKARFFFVRLSESGEMIAGGFYVLHGSVIDALMPSFRSEHAGMAPNFLLAAHTLRWARAAGLRYYNWQASPPEGGVRRFKLQWGSADLPYSIHTRVTGDASAFHAATPERIQADYRWHYVLPFDAVGSAPGGEPRRSQRGPAWKSAEPESS